MKHTLVLAALLPLLTAGCAAHTEPTGRPPAPAPAKAPAPKAPDLSDVDLRPPRPPEPPPGPAPEETRPARLADLTVRLARQEARVWFLRDLLEVTEAAEETYLRQAVVAPAPTGGRALPWDLEMFRRVAGRLSAELRREEEELHRLQKARVALDRPAPEPLAGRRE
jgi:hypothetical protein